MRWLAKLYALIAGCCLLFALFQGGALDSALHERFAGADGGSVEAELASPGSVSAVVQRCISWFQRAISPIDAGRCQMYPTCSEYSKQAIAKHGVLMGLVMTFDRLLHEYDEPSFAPRVVVGGRVRYYDPVSANDFWWCQEAGGSGKVLERKALVTW